MKSYKNKEHMIVDQEVPGSRPGGGTIYNNFIILNQTHSKCIVIL